MNFFSRQGGPAPSARQRTSGSKTFAAPTRGLVLNENLARSKAGGAIILENFTPTSKGIKMRRGSAVFATVHATLPVESMMNYDAGTVKKLFAAANGSIFDITSVADPLVPPAASVTGQTSNYYSFVNFTATSGSYLFAVNGTDSLQLYDGTDWWPITTTGIIALPFDTQTANFTVGLVVTGGTSAATGTIVRQTDAGTSGTLYLKLVTGTFVDNETITDSGTGSALVNGSPSTHYAPITGAASSTFVDVFIYRNRIYFIKKNARTVYYLPVDSIGGALGTLSLNGVLKKGGNLKFGATWSLDAGDGVDDKLVLVSDRGERVVYEGDNPADAAWRLVGVYDGSPPLGIRGKMSAGGDLLIADETGLVAVSASITKDPGAIGLSAVSRNFEPLWTPAAIARRSLPWECIKWAERQIAIISTPVTSGNDSAQCFIMNLETGAPAVYTGWNTRSLALHNSIVYFGTNAGKIMTAETGGIDGSTPYVCKAALAWDHCGSEGAWKEYTSIRAIFRKARPFTAKLSASTDYATVFPTAPAAAAGVATSLWDEGLWDVALWDSSAEVETVTIEWQSLEAAGSVASVQLQITSGSTSAPVCELVSLHLLFNEGELFT